MYNLRYHIASLVAVFLALAIGLLLGTIVVERGVLDRQRTTLVKSLQTDFTGMKKENEELRRDRDREHAFAQDAVPTLIAGMLRGKSVLIITNAGRNDGLSVTRDTLRAAGADSVVATFKSKDFGRGEPGGQDALTGIATRTPGVAGANDPVVAALADEWSKRGLPQPLTDQLRSAGQVSIEGSSTEIAPDAVVLLASFDGSADPALVSLVAAMQKTGTAAAGVESQGVATGVADAALGAGLSTVDDVDRPEGMVSLVYVLAGRAEGHFGVKSGATTLYPKLR
ncbi:MAG TPA: copper transporter [Coriobacteriia bacterium]|jgi:hypothetical protein